MDDFSLQFRRFVHLDRKRAGSGLTPSELRRWMKLKRILNQQFTPDPNFDALEQRESVRVPARVNVSFRDVGELRECVMTNVSRGGLFITTDCPLDIATRFELSIELEKTRDRVRVPVEVVSVNARPDRGTFESGMGVRFCEMNEALRAKLDGLYEGALKQAAERKGVAAKKPEPVAAS